jgi:phage portal protein BeeE
MGKLVVSLKSLKMHQRGASNQQKPYTLPPVTLTVAVTALFHCCSMISEAISSIIILIWPENANKSPQVRQ